MHTCTVMLTLCQLRGCSHLNSRLSAVAFVLTAMPCSNVTLMKRAFVKLLLSLALAYEVGLKVNRDSEDKEVLTAYKRMALKLHPDKGGRKQDFQKLFSCQGGMGEGTPETEVPDEMLTFVSMNENVRGLDAQYALWCDKSSFRNSANH